MDTGGDGGSVRGDVIGDCRAGDELLHFVVKHGDAGHEAEGEDKIREWACEGHGDALPSGVRVELSGIAGGSFARGVSGGCCRRGWPAALVAYTLLN